MAKAEQEMVSLNDQAGLRSPLIKEDLDSPAGTPGHHNEAVIAEEEEPYYESTTEPKVPFKRLLLALLPGVLVSSNILLSEFVGIPTLQYFFLTTLLSFLLNYSVLRKYQLYPFIKEPKYDRLLKAMCVLTFASVLFTVQWGWNGGVGIVVGIIWEAVRGNKIRGLGLGFLMVIVGCALLEGTWDTEKLLELVPGVLLGFVNATLYTLGETSPYTIYHEFSLLCSIFLPMFFPLQPMIKLSLLQWGVVVLGAIFVLFTALLTIKMMQKERVSIAITATCAIITLMTTKYTTTVGIMEGVLVGLGLAFILYKEYAVQEPEL